MISKELKHLSRRELVDIIYQLKQSEQETKEEIESLKKELEDKRIRICSAGSVADAALLMTNIFSTAQETADIYLREITCMKEETEKICAKKMEDADKKVKDILADGKKKFDILRTAYKSEYAKWQQLQAEIAAYKQKKKQELCEDVTNG